MVSQGSIHEGDGIMSDYPAYVWSSDGGTPSSVEGDSNSDENLIHEVSGCPTIRRLQRVALRHQRRSNELLTELELARADVVNLESEAEQHAQHISELSMYVVNVSMERDEARKLSRYWKLLACVLGFVVFVCVFYASM